MGNCDKRVTQRRRKDGDVCVCVFEGRVTKLYKKKKESEVVHRKRKKGLRRPQTSMKVRCT